MAISFHRLPGFGESDEWISQRRPMIDKQIRTRAVGSLPAKEQLFAEMAAQQHLPELCKLREAMEAFAKAFQDRDNHSPQAAAVVRRALMENHNSLLDGFPELVEILREVAATKQPHTLTDDVGLGLDQLLDMLHMVADDHVDPACSRRAAGGLVWRGRSGRPSCRPVRWIASAANSPYAGMPPDGKC